MQLVEVQVKKRINNKKRIRISSSSEDEWDCVQADSSNSHDDSATTDNESEYGTKTTKAIKRAKVKTTKKTSSVRVPWSVDQKKALFRSFRGHIKDGMNCITSLKLLNLKINETDLYCP